jgi:hypothetical protein
MKTLAKLLTAVFLPVFFQLHAETSLGYLETGLKWTLNLSDSTLTISGTGAIPDHDTLPSSQSPWYNNRMFIAKINIEPGITRIGKYAFLNCSSLTAVTIPDDVTNIGEHAFSNCSSLTAVIIPDGVTSIEKYTFSNCSSLTAVTIPNSVTSIEKYAFSNCSSLTAVIIPDGVTSIGEYVFSNCSNLTAVTIPNGVTSIEKYAFLNCTALASIAIPRTVTDISTHAFFGCTGLTSYTNLSLTPQIYSGVESDYNIEFSNISLFVPDSVHSAYNTSFWCFFKMGSDTGAPGWSPGIAITEISMVSDTTLIWEQENLLTAIAGPANTNQPKTITWSCADTFVTVTSYNDNTCYVNATREGTTVIKAITVNPPIYATCKVNIVSESNATLKSLSVNSSYGNTAITPVPAIVDTVRVPYSVDSVKVLYETCNPYASDTLSGPDTLAVGDNPYTVKVVSSNGQDTNNYRIMVKRLSNSTALNRLTVNSRILSPVGNNSYTVSVPYETTNITITAETHAGATVTGAGKKTGLAVGDTVCTITVISEDSTAKQDYDLIVRRLNNNTALDSLAVNGKTATPVDDYYTVSVPYATTNVTITAENHAGGTVTGTGKKTGLTVGNNNRLITVIAEDTVFTKTHTLVIRRLSNNTTLNSLTVNGKTASSVDDYYTVSVPYATINVTITAGSTDGTVTGDGEKTNLAVGDNIYPVTVTAEDTTFTKVYDLIVHRLDNSTVLDSLVVNGKTASLVENIYQISVPYATTDITIEAKNHVYAIATGDGKKTDLAVGDTAYTVTVISEDSTAKQNYDLIVRRLNNNTALDTFSVAGKIPSLVGDIYTVSVPYSTTDITITAENHAGGTVTGDGEKTDLAVGDNPFVIMVTAEDATFKQSYNLIVTRLTADAVWSGLAASPGMLAAQVYLAGQALHVHSPVAEQVYIYSITGDLLGSWDKGAGKVSFTVNHTVGKLLIVKGSTGWCRKIVVID